MDDISSLKSKISVRYVILCVSMPGECAMAEAKRTMSITHDGIDFNESVYISVVTVPKCQYSVPIPVKTSGFLF